MYFYKIIKDYRVSSGTKKQVWLLESLAETSWELFDLISRKGTENASNLGE
jgi:hypothetical protein